MADKTEHEDEVRVVLPEYVRLIAREAGFAAAKEVLSEHRRNCPIKVVDKRSQDNADKITEMKIRWGILAGFMVGSGLVGGGVGALAAKLIGG